MGNPDQQNAIASREDSSDGLLFTILILVALLLTAACDPGARRHAPGPGPAGSAPVPAEDLRDLAVLLSTDRAVYGRADPVFVTFTLANHSDEDHVLPRLTAAGPGTWFIEVRDVDGRPVAQRRDAGTGRPATMMERLDAGRFVRVTCPLETCPVLGPVETSLPPGAYALVGVYESPEGGVHDGPVWSGRLESEPARVEIMGGSLLARN